MQIDYTIRFDQPWHVGSGEGAGPFLDQRVRRDGFDLPFLPGTSIQGLVADAVRCLCVLLGVDTCDGTLERRSDDTLRSLCGVTRPGRCPVCALTGSPHREGDARFGAAEAVLASAGEALREPSQRRRVATEAAAVPGLLARSHPHTSIDRRSGRAADERLFSVEEASGELRLSGRVELPRETSRRDVALLVGALRWIHEAGGGRRRGLGGCRIGIDGADLAPHFGSWQEAVQYLKSLPAAEAATEVPLGAPMPVPPVASAQRLDTTVLRLDAVVRGEVAVGGRPQAGNLIAGLAHVPGSAVRGAFAALWTGDREDEEFGRCFLDGSVRFGFLLPVYDDRTALPRPLSLYTCKLRPGPQGHGLVDLLGRPDQAECRDRDCRGRLMPWSPPFLAGGTPVDPPLLLSPHNRIEFSSQTVKEGSLFAYEALPGGAALRGFLRAAAPEVLERFLSRTGIALGETFRLRVGRRKGALGWLDCTLTIWRGEDGGVGLFPDADRVPGRLRGPTDLRIDLVTPAIVLDERLRFRESLPPGAFGLDRESFDEVYARADVVSGWSAAHRLPKPDQVAVAAGSSFLLRKATEAERAILQETAATGIGLRRVEGFGSFVVRIFAAEEAT